MSMRQQVVQNAMRWVGTPYRHEGDLIGEGVDCLMLLVRVYQSVGVLPAEFDPRPYPVQYHMHHEDERYLDGVLVHCDEVSAPRPGDIGLWRIGKCYSHGGVLVDDHDGGRVVHSYLSRGVLLSELSDPVFRNRRGALPVRWFAPRGLQ